MPESLPGTVDAAVPGTTLEHEPQWLRALAFASAAAVAAFGGVGLALADAGAYRSYFAFPLGALAWFALLVLARPILLARGAKSARAHVVAVLGLLFIGGITLWNARHASQHVLINRDPGVYVNAGVQIAQRGTLVYHDPVIAAVPAFARDLFFPQDTNRGEYYLAQRFNMGFYILNPETGATVSQFPHVYPASIAIGYALDGLAGARRVFAFWGVRPA